MAGITNEQQQKGTTDWQAFLTLPSNGQPANLSTGQKVFIKKLTTNTHSKKGLFNGAATYRYRFCDGCITEQ
jgi:hypothetical protein